MLQVEHLSVTYPDGTAAIAEVSFTVADGESVALIGANGAGKTSLMLSLVGVLPCKGTVTLDGISLSEATVPVIRQKAGLVFQDPDDQLFMPSLYDDLAFGLRNAGMAEAEIGMLSTVLVGNSRTFVRHGLMVTPRGYANKYEVEGSKNTRDGEKAGRSLSTGLNGWQETVRAAHAAGSTIEALAAEYRLPADYIRMTIDEPMRDTTIDAEEGVEA